MKTSLKNNSGQPLAKSHTAAIIKDATKLAERHTTMIGCKLLLNKTTTAIYSFSVVDCTLVDINVTRVEHAAA
jgi:hypothetical protein